MDNRDDVSVFQSERLFFHHYIIHENISTSDETMKKITSIFVVLSEVDIDPVSSVAFVSDDVRFLGHEYSDLSSRTIFNSSLREECGDPVVDCFVPHSLRETLRNDY